MYPTPRDLAGFFLWFIRERKREAIRMAMTVGVVTSVGNQVKGRHCRGRPATGGGRRQVLDGVGGRCYLQDEPRPLRKGHDSCGGSYRDLGVDGRPTIFVGRLRRGDYG
jgi:hypothetical protein